MEHVIRIATVNFKTVWGDKEANLHSMERYIQAAAEKGADLIVFPETALTGYSNEADAPREAKMHTRLAEPIPGPATEYLSRYAVQHDMMIVFGLAERDGETVYNSAAILKPDGSVERYRKIHLPFDEAEWAAPGREPWLIDSKWGPIGLTICYDTYCFPELTRYFRAKGARLSLNVTACPDANCTYGSAKLAIPAYAFINYMFIASANLCCEERGNRFPGGSGVVGPVPGGVKAYVGHMFGDEGCDTEGLFVGDVDLSLADRYGEIPVFLGAARGTSDWQGELYAELYRSVRESN